MRFKQHLTAKNWSQMQPLKNDATSQMMMTISKTACHKNQNGFHPIVCGNSLFSNDGIHNCEF